MRPTAAKTWMFFLPIFMVAGIVISTAPAKALSINPPIFEFHADPGDHIEDEILVFNDRAEGRVIVRPEAVNFMAKAQDETSGTPQFYPGEEMRNGYELAPWMAFDEEEIELPPFDRQDLGFRIDVPEDASPGSYFGAAILRTPGGSERGVGLETGTAVLMILRVNGEVDASAHVTEFFSDSGMYSTLPIRFEARVANRGNVHLQPSGKIVVKNVFGTTVTALDVNTDRRSVLPDSARRFEASWGTSADPSMSEFSRQWHDFTFGFYTAELDLVYGPDQEHLTASTAFWVIPWMAILALIGGGLILLIVIRRFLRWYVERVIRRHHKGKK